MSGSSFESLLKRLNALANETIDVIKTIAAVSATKPIKIYSKWANHQFFNFEIIKIFYHKH